MNEALIIALTAARDACAKAASEVAACKHSENPDWMRAEDVLNECDDELLAMIGELTASEDCSK